MSGTAAWRTIALVITLSVLLVAIWVFGAGRGEKQSQMAAKAPAHVPIPCDQLEAHLISVNTERATLAHVLQRLCECDVPLSEAGRQMFFLQYFGVLSLNSIEEIAMIPAYDDVLVCRASDLLRYWLDRMSEEDADAVTPTVMYAPSILEVFATSDNLDVEEHRLKLESLLGHPNELVTEAVEEFLAAVDQAGRSEAGGAKSTNEP